MRRNTLPFAFTVTALAGLAATLAQPAHALHWADTNFSWSLTNGGCFLVMAYNPVDNSISLEGLSSDWSSSASHIWLTGRYGAPPPQFTAIANTTNFTGDVGIGTYSPAGSL